MVFFFANPEFEYVVIRIYVSCECSASIYDTYLIGISMLAIGLPELLFQRIYGTHKCFDTILSLSSLFSHEAQTLLMPLVKFSLNLFYFIFLFITLTLYGFEYLVIHIYVGFECTTSVFDTLVIGSCLIPKHFFLCCWTLSLMIP